MRHDRFNYRGTFKCQLCERTTRDSGQGVDHLCSLCFDLCGIDNMINDNEYDPKEYRAECDAMLRKIEKKGGNVAKVVRNNSFIWPEGEVK